MKDEHRALAMNLFVDVELEAAAFRDHEFARPRTDVDAAFRNWIREASRRPRPRIDGIVRVGQPVPAGQRRGGPVQPSHGLTGAEKGSFVR